MAPSSTLLQLFIRFFEGVVPLVRILVDHDMVLLGSCPVDVINSKPETIIIPNYRAAS
jgi:hypothetical protein